MLVGKAVSVYSTQTPTPPPLPSPLVLTLGYLNLALNNPAQGGVRHCENKPFAQEHNTIRMTLAGPRPRPFDTGTKELISGSLCLQYILSPLVVQRDSIWTSALDDYKKERLRTKR